MASSPNASGHWSQRAETREPLPRFRRYLEAKGLLDERLQAGLEAEADAEVRQAIERAEARMKQASPGEMFDHVYATLPAELEAQRRELGPEFGSSSG